MLYKDGILILRVSCVDIFMQFIVKQEYKMSIGLIIVAVIVAVLGIHFWLHRLMKFKMDESSIVKYLRNTGSEAGVHSTHTIASRTDIGVGRVQAVCMKSAVIQKHAEDGEAWSVKT